MNRQDAINNINELLQEKAELMGKLEDLKIEMQGIEDEIAEINKAVRKLNSQVDFLDGNDIIIGDYRKWK